MTLSPRFPLADPRPRVGMRSDGDIAEADVPEVARSIVRSRGVRPVAWLLPEIVLDLHRSGDSRGELELCTRRFGPAAVAELQNGFAVRGRISAVAPAPAALIVLGAPAGARANGRLVREGDVFAVPPGSGLVATLPAGTRLGILVAERVLTNGAHAIDDEHFADLLAARAGPAQARRIADLYDSLQSRDPARDVVAGDLINAVVMAATSTRPGPSGPRSRSLSSERIVADVLSYLESRSKWKMPLQELEAVAGVSDRRVQMAFRELLGVSPSRYMRARALQAAHDSLRGAGRRAQSVSFVALDHGFDHLGRFSSYYREMFGESPSDTRRRAA